MIRQLTTPESGHDEGPLHTNTHSQGPLPSNRDHVTNTWLSYTNKEISPLLTKCGEIPHKNPAQWSQMGYREKLVVHHKTQTIA